MHDATESTIHPRDIILLSTDHAYHIFCALISQLHTHSYATLCFNVQKTGEIVLVQTRQPNSFNPLWAH